MNSKIKKIIKEITKILVEKYDPEKIILFGSLVSGVFTEDSDIDLLIVKTTDTKSRIDRFVEVKRIIYNPKIRIPVSPLVLTKEELKERLDMGDDFLKEIITRGEVLYER